MKKKVLISIVALAILVSFYKYMQSSFLGLSTPQIETKQSITEYASNNGIAGDIFIAKDKKSFETFKKYFDYGNIYVLDNNFDLIDCNFESLGGRCYQDIQNDICNNVEIAKRDFQNIHGKQIMDTLLLHSTLITRTDSIDFKKYNRIYLYTWVKYAKASVDENSLKFISHLSALNDPRNLIITVNTDSLLIYR